MKKVWQTQQVKGLDLQQPSTGCCQKLVVIIWNKHCESHVWADTRPT